MPEVGLGAEGISRIRPVGRGDRGVRVRYELLERDRYSSAGLAVRRREVHGRRHRVPYLERGVRPPGDADNKAGQRADVVVIGAAVVANPPVPGIDVDAHPVTAPGSGWLSGCGTDLDTRPKCGRRWP